MRIVSSLAIFVHILFWAGYLFLMTNLLAFRIGTSQAFIMAISMIIPQSIIAYINMEVLIPKYLINKRYRQYVLSIIFLLGSILTYFIFIIPLFIDQFPFKPPIALQLENGRFRGPGGMVMTPFRGAVFINSVQTLGILFLSSALKSSQIALKKATEAALLRSESLDAELRFLKSQVNPHFLFNSLNNLYALAIAESPKTPDIILKLSDILRYMIYDGKEDKVSLTKEIEYLKNFIELFKLKDENLTNINYHFDNVPSHLMIEPMLFIPFIENSFKHSKIEDLEKGWINIDLNLKQGQINFKVENSIPQVPHTKDSVGGIGLENIERRLSLLYPDRHDLKIVRTADTFSIKLTLLI